MRKIKFSRAQGFGHKQGSGLSLFMGISIVVLVFLANPPTARAFVFEEKVATTKALAHYSMGQVYDLLGMVDRAILEYEKAAYFDESSYLIHLRRGIDYARLNMLSEAKEALKLVPRYNPQDLQSHYLLALIYSTEKQYEQAGQEYELILKTFSKDEPGNIAIYGYLGQLYYSQRKYDQAIAQFEHILELEPKNVDVMYLLGSLHSEIGEYKRAEDILKQALEIDPQHEGCLNTLGYIYAEQGTHLQDAEKMIERALSLDPKNGAYLDSLGWVYYKQNKFDRALKTLEKADSLLKDPVIYEHLGDVYLKLKQTEKALEYWKLSLELLPGQEELIKKISEHENAQVRQNL